MCLNIETNQAHANIITGLIVVTVLMRLYVVSIVVIYYVILIKYNLVNVGGYPYLKLFHISLIKAIDMNSKN